MGETDAHRGDRDPAAVKDLEELLEPVAARAEQVPLGTAAPWNESSRVSDARQPTFCIGAEIS